MDRFEEMRAFVAVVDRGSFVAAADAIQSSKSAVSRMVGELESRLGVRLLHRTTRRLSLTEEGQVFHARCQEVLGQLEEAESEVTARAGEAVGRLKVSAPVTFGLTHLASQWPKFLARHPRVTLEVTLSDRFVDLVDEGFDAAVRIARLPNSSLVSRKLASTRLTLCASPAYLAAHGTPARLADLSGHSVIDHSSQVAGDQWQFDGPEGAQTVKVNPRMLTNSGDSCCEAAVQGLGIVLQPSFLLTRHLATGALVELLPDYRSYALGIHLVYPSRQHLSPKVRALVDHMVEAFREPDWAA
jgi:DNA-binding transcriptional LysR family regulator